MKATTKLILGLLIVLAILVIYAVVKKPAWSDPAFWLANFVESPLKVYQRSGGAFDEEAALAFDRATSGRNPSPGDHLLAATIITRNILGQEHRPEINQYGQPTEQAVERAQLRHEMFGRARGHYMEALRGLTQQMGVRPAVAAAQPGQTPRETARAARRARSRPPPPDAGFMVDAALDFAIGGMTHAVQNDPILAVMFGREQDADPGDVLAQLTMFIDMDLAGVANKTREQIVEQRRAAAQQVAAASGGSAGARVDAYVDMAINHTDDPENAHDSGVNGCLRGIMARLRADQEGTVLPTLDEIEDDIRANWMAYAGGNQKTLEDILAVVARAKNGEKSVAIDATDEEVLRRIWARADDPLNAENRSKLRQASADNLKDSWKTGVTGRRIVCVNGRTSRQIGSLSTIDYDTRNWDVATLEQFKNDIFEKTKALILEEAQLASESADPVMSKVGRSYLVKTPEETAALGEVDSAAGEKFAEMLRTKIDPMVDAYVVEVNTRTDGGIPQHFVAPIKAEAKAAII